MSQSVQNTRSPQWPVHKINIAKLCNADELIPFRFIFFSGLNRLGYCQTNLKECNEKKALQFVSEVGNQNGGTVQVLMNQWDQRVKPSFVDYLRSGWQLSMTASIDYTLSNKGQDLHSMTKPGGN